MGQLEEIFRRVDGDENTHNSYLNKTIQAELGQSSANSTKLLSKRCVDYRHLYDYSNCILYVSIKSVNTYDRKKRSVHNNWRILFALVQQTRYVSCRLWVS
ncbi:unnamed protein product [Rhizophagus irregularis]|nr:unnamed protein product [Rhizophagus irregularis]